jgi:hypothetical protein
MKSSRFTRECWEARSPRRQSPAGLLLAALLGTSCLARAQTIDSGAATVLRSALLVPQGARLDITRDYSTLFFPGVVFYHAHWSNGVDIPDTPAAFVQIGDSGILLTTMADLGQVWKRGLSKRTSRSSYSVACRDLLFRAGFLEWGDRTLTGPNDLNENERAVLSPRDAYRRVTAPLEQQHEGSLTSSFYVLTAIGLLHYVCSFDSRDQLSVAVDTIARGPLP